MKEKTKVGAFIAKAAPWLLDVAGDITKIGALNELADKIENDDRMDPVDKQVALELIQAALKDRANARDMQRTALQQTDMFSKRFVYYLASFIMLVLSVLLVLLFYVEIPEGNGEIIYMAIGIFMGIASTVAAFFFGSSSGSKDKQAGIDRLIEKIR